ncbi:MAG: ABC transporter ATP-binding protein [Planctomycetota bacterium]
MTGTPFIRLVGVGRSYPMGESSFQALRDIDLEIRHGELAAIFGPSGSGKSTLMHLMGCLDTPSIGRFEIEGREVSKLSSDERAELRGRLIGFVFQSFNLLPRTSALDNVELPLLYQGLEPRQRRQRAREALERVGLGGKLSNTPAQLSGGQQQRVAIARAIVTRPSLLLADEPTGNLDSASGADILSLLLELHKAGSTLLLVTHDPLVAAHAPRRIEIRDGRVASDRVPA